MSIKKHDWTDEALPELVEEEIETVEDCKKNIGCFISYNNLFSTWLKMGKSFDVSNVTDALSAFALKRCLLRRNGKNGEIDFISWYS
ncbi:MAG: hypothetical protein NC225_07200 [Clostridium sp.]|nr:hypothetical protein [Clostridium sp.]MCM1399249.1 hypothetical protein [Clostridium sp.]MCM1459739.1 hypothetical protein [Bacteroides sp.]